MKLDLQKEFYFFEWTRKAAIESASSLPVGILTVLGSGAVYLVRTFTYDTSAACVAFIALVAASGVALVAATFLLARSLRGDWYKQLPMYQRLRLYHDELVKYHQALGNPISNADDDYEDYLASRLAEAADVNRDVNRKTGGALVRATGWLIVALVCLGASFIPYLAQSLTRPVPAQRVRIEGGVSIAPQEVHQMPTDQNRPEPQSQPRPQQQPQPQQSPAPQRPQGPPNEEIRKGGDIRPRR